MDPNDEDGGGEVVQAIGLVALFGAIMTVVVAGADRIAGMLETLMTTTIGALGF